MAKVLLLLVGLAAGVIADPWVRPVLLQAGGQQGGFPVGAWYYYETDSEDCSGLSGYIEYLPNGVCHEVSSISYGDAGIFLMNVTRGVGTWEIDANGILIERWEAVEYLQHPTQTGQKEEESETTVVRMEIHRSYNGKYRTKETSDGLELVYVKIQ